MSCKRQFTLSEAASTCPEPEAVTFTMPAGEAHLWDDDENYYGTANIDGTTLVARATIDYTTYAIEVVDLSGTPAVVSQFQINSEGLWQAQSLCYDSTNNEIVVWALKGAVWCVAFFDPTTGYKTSTVVAIPANSFPTITIPKSGSTGKLLTYSMRSQADVNAYVYQIDVAARSATLKATITPTAGSSWNELSFAYSCTRDAFIVCESNILYQYQNMVFALEGGALQKTITSGYRQFDYIPGADRLVGEGAYNIYIRNIDTGATEADLDVNTLFGGVYYIDQLIPVGSVKFAFDLNAIMLPLIREDAIAEGLLVMLDPSDLSYIGHTIINPNGYVNHIYIYKMWCDPTDGAITLMGQARDGQGIFDPWYNAMWRLTPTIT